MEIHEEKWGKTDCKVGMYPLFKVICSVCTWDFFYRSFGVGGGAKDIWRRIRNKMADGDFDMFLRETDCTTLRPISDRAHANNMHYKCDRCDRVKVFGVAIDKEYYDELIKRRGSARYIPVELWDTEKQKKLLMSLGYI